MYNAAKEEYVYAIAGGETLQVIDYLERVAANAKQELITYTESIGILATPAADHPYRFNYTLKDPAAPVPAGWELDDYLRGLHVTPAFFDVTSDEAKKTGRILFDFHCRMDVQSQFDDLCHSLAPSSHLNNRKYSYEKLGDDIIVACPKQYEGDAIIPTGSTPISWLDYVTLQEKANPTPAPQTRVFQKKFSPNG